MSNPTKDYVLALTKLLSELKYMPYYLITTVEEAFVQMSVSFTRTELQEECLKLYDYYHSKTKHESLSLDESKEAVKSLRYYANHLKENETGT